MATDIIFGEQATFRGSDSRYGKVVALNDETVVVAYNDVADSNHGTAKVGSVSGSDVVFGAETEFMSSGTGGVTTLDIKKIDDDRFLLAYRDGPSDNNGVAVVGTVSGTTITFGDASGFMTTLGGSVIDITLSMFSETKFVVGYADSGQGTQGFARIGTISGTTVTFGDETRFLLGHADWIDVATINESGFVVSYQDGRTNPKTAQSKIGTVDGTAITFGAESEFDNDGDFAYISIAKLDPDRVVITYRGKSATYLGRAIVGTISGTTITYGDQFTYNNGASFYTSVTTVSATRFIVGCWDNSDGAHGTVTVGTVTGTDIEFGTENTFVIGAASYVSVDLINQNKFIVGYRDDSDSNRGKANIGLLYAQTIDEFDLFIEGLGGILKTGELDLFTKGCASITGEIDLFVGGYELTTGEIGLFIPAPPPDLYASKYMFVGGYQNIWASGALFIEGFGLTTGEMDLFIAVGATQAAGIPLRIVHRLVKTGDYDPQLIGIFDDIPVNVTIEVWDIVGGSNTSMILTDNNCYAIGNTDKWGWSTAHLRHTGQKKKYQYYFRMTSNELEEVYGEFFITVPERGRFSYPD
jgi:hypothetical protein